MSWKKPTIKHGVMTQWNWLVLYPENLDLGDRVDIGAFTLIACQSGVSIGDDVQIGSHCSIYSKSTIDNKSAPVVIGKGARIGTHSTIMPGVTVGENAIVGAHSFVNRDIPGGETWCGIPARRKK